MVAPEKIFGRLGNKLFQYAFLFSFAKDNDIDYYFQDEYFFKNNANMVRALFSTDIPNYTDKVAIHVRRGANPINKNEPKYIDNPFYVNVSDTDYYERAIAMFPESNFLVFSDDLQWCREKWAHLENFSFATGNEIEDLNLMASCKAHIIANSSFSWWAAYLSPSYPDNKVIAPKEWYSDGIERTVLPEHWTRI